MWNVKHCFASCWLISLCSPYWEYLEFTTYSFKSIRKMLLCCSPADFFLPLLYYVAPHKQRAYCSAVNSGMAVACQKVCWSWWCIWLPQPFCKHRTHVSCSCLLIRPDWKNWPHSLFFQCWPVERCAVGPGKLMHAEYLSTVPARFKPKYAGTHRSDQTFTQLS